MPARRVSGEAQKNFSPSRTDSLKGLAVKDYSPTAVSTIALAENFPYGSYGSGTMLANYKSRAGTLALCGDEPKREE